MWYGITIIIVVAKNKASCYNYKGFHIVNVIRYRSILCVAKNKTSSSSGCYIKINSWQIFVIIKMTEQKTQVGHGEFLYFHISKDVWD